ITENAQSVLAQCHAAHEAGAHVVVTPEMVLTGYPIEDLAYRSTFIERSRQAVQELADTLLTEGLGDLVVIVGHLDTARTYDNRRQHPKNQPTNTASVITGGRVVARYDKHHLPNYGVFDEFRHFVPGDE